MAFRVVPIVLGVVKIVVQRGAVLHAMRNARAAVKQLAKELVQQDVKKHVKQVVKTPVNLDVRMAVYQVVKISVIGDVKQGARTHVKDFVHIHAILPVKAVAQAVATIAACITALDVVGLHIDSANK